MRKGISPIVAVVLLIAISVVAATGLYFWAGGIVTKQDTPETPISISAYAIDATNGVIAIANLGSDSLVLSELQTGVGTTCDFGGEVTIESGEQALCTMPPFSGTTVLFGTSSGGSGTGQAVINTEGSGIQEVTFQEDSFDPITWTADLPSGTFGTNTTEGSVKLIGETPTFTGSWPSRFYSLSSNRDVDGGSPSLNNILGTYTMGSWSWSTPAIANGYVYIGSGDNKVYQLNASDVTQLIATYTTGGIIYSSPAVSGDYVYIGSRDDKIYQLNASNVSDMIASYTTVSNIDSSPVVYGDYVYVGSGDNTIYQLNASNVSDLILSHDLGGGGISYSTPAISNEYLYIGSGDDKIYQLNVSDVSDVIASYTAGGDVHTSPVVSGGYVYIGSSDHNFYQLNATNVSHMIASYDTGGQMYSTAAVSGEYVYVGTDNFKFYQLNASDVSQVINSYTTTGQFQSSPTLSGGFVYIGNSNDRVYQFNATNISQLVTSYKTGADVYSTPAVVGNVLYVASEDTKLYAFGGYMRSGYYYSETMDSGNESTNWTSIDWVENIPTNTILTMYTNVTNTTNAGTWDLISNGNVAGVGRYIRFRAKLDTTDGINTPILSSVNALYRQPEGNITYTVNSDTSLSYVTLEQNCSGIIDDDFANETITGTFYTNTVEAPTTCEYTVYGPGITNQTYP